MKFEISRNLCQNPTSKSCTPILSNSKKPDAYFSGKTNNYTYSNWNLVSHMTPQYCLTRGCHETTFLDFDFLNLWTILSQENLGLTACASPDNGEQPCLNFHFCNELCVQLQKILWAGHRYIKFPNFSVTVLCKRPQIRLYSEVKLL